MLLKRTRGRAQLAGRDLLVKMPGFNVLSGHNVGDICPTIIIGNGCIILASGDMRMNADFTRIRGVGPSTAEDFKKNGFQSINDLASASIADIMAIPGFQLARATQVIASAKAAMSEGGDDQPEQKKPNKKAKAKKKKKDPKKAKRGKKKDKKKSKGKGKKKKVKKSKDKNKAKKTKK